MSDLISRKEVINLLHILHLDNMRYGADDKTAIDYVEELPTAYDVKSVVKQLEEQKANKVEWEVNSKIDVLAHFYNGQVIAFIDAIEIVKSGGSDE